MRFVHDHMHPGRARVGDPLNMGSMTRPDGAAAARRRLLLAAAALGIAGPGRAQSGPAASRRITVGVEATLQASGLAARWRAAVARDTGLAIDWQPGPSGLLLPQLERGELDAAITQSPEHERLLEAQNLVHDRRPVAATDYVLVGPRPARKPGAASAADPAGLAGERDAARALARLAAAGTRGEASFVAAGEPGGDRALEQALWKASGPQPIGAWLRTAGPGPTAALALARETGSYALVERGLWSAHGGAPLAVLVEGDPRLAVTYHVMRSFRVRHPGAKLLVDWLAGANGRRVVAGFGRGYRRA